MKTCTKCRVEKEDSDFSIRNTSTGALASSCKKCMSEYRKANRSRHAEYCRKYIKANGEKIAARQRALRMSDPQKEALRSKKWREANPGYYAKKCKQWRVENPEKVAAQQKSWLKANPGRKAAYEKNRRKTDPLFDIRIRVIRLIENSIRKKKFTKNSKTFKILGCTYEQFAKHLESLFTTGMSWDNRAEWHIDHRIPVASAKTEEEIIKLNHYTNLQPLWSIDNRKKGSKMPAAPLLGGLHDSV